MSLFTSPWPVQEGIIRALPQRPRLPLAQASNFWPLTASLYEPLWRHRSLAILTLGTFTTARELEQLSAWVAPQAGELILDAACSTGLYARTILTAEPAATVHALDFSLPFLQQARRYAARDGVAPILVEADVTALPYRSKVADAVVSGGSLNEFLDLAGALREFARVLKPGGRLWLMYLTNAVSLPGRALQGLARLSGLRFITPQALERSAAGYGLTLVKADYRGVVAMALYRSAKDASQVNGRT